MAASHRVEHVLAAMAARGMDILVGVSDGFHNFLACDPVVSLAGFRAMGPCAVVLRANGDGWLIVSPAWDAARARAQVGHLDVIGAGDLAEGVLARLQALRPARIGTSYPASLACDLLDRLEAFPAERVAGAAELLLRAGAIKTEDELADAREATRIAQAGHERLLEVLRPGLREHELAAEMLHHMKALGSHDNFLLMSASQHNHAVRPPGRRVLERGDVLLAEITPAVNNQLSQICRTVVIGPASALQQERFALLKSAYAAGASAAKAGARVAQATRAMNDVISAAGFGAWCRPPYMRVRGHGLGNVSHVPGDITADNETVLEEGMVFVMHPNQYFPDVGYLMCGEPVVIGADAAQALSTVHARLDVVNA